MCVEDNHLIFKSKEYTQHDGFAMRSPLCASMAYIFLCHHEKKWLDDFPQDFKSPIIDAMLMIHF